MELSRTKILFLALAAVFVIVLCIAVPIGITNSEGGSSDIQQSRRGQEQVVGGTHFVVVGVDNMGNKQGKSDRSDQPVVIQTAPGHRPYNAPPGADQDEAAMMQMVRPDYIRSISLGGIHILYYE